jgi:hypothetical protein
VAWKERQRQHLAANSLTRHGYEEELQVHKPLVLKLCDLDGEIRVADI